MTVMTVEVSEWEKLEQRVKELEKALRWYATQHKYPVLAFEDGGQIAKAALKKVE